MDAYIPPEDQPQVRTAIDADVRGKRMFEMEHRVRRADDTLGWIHSRAVPMLGRNGEIAEWIGAASDVTGVRQAELDRRASEERLRNVIEVARVDTWDWDIRTGEVAWSDEHFRMMGFAVTDTAPGYEAWIARVHPDDREATMAALRRVRETREEYVNKYRALHPDGTVRWLSARGRYLYDEAGEPLRMIGAMVDITDAREQQQQRQEVLVGELQHRTRNLMAVVRSMADKTMRRAQDLDSFKADFATRLDALARVQGLLSRLDEHGRVTFDELLRAELAAHGALDEPAERVVLSGPDDIRLRSSMVQMLAMGLHELATNATKYGALHQPGGRLKVDWRLVEQDQGLVRLKITWQEHGVVMPPEDALQRGGGQGRELIERALPYQLGATTSYEIGPDGVSCVMIVPISTTPA